MPTCSITGARYKTALQSYVILKLQQRNVINGIVWMQNDAPMLTATNVRQVLQQYFEKGIAAYNFALSWPPHCDGFQVLGLAEI